MVDRYDFSGMTDDRPLHVSRPGLPVGGLDDLIATSGIRRVHVLAWRDLDDPEAGGSELHAHEVMRRWTAAGLEVTARTSVVVGLPPDHVRDGYRVVRRAGRYGVFPAAVLAEVGRRHGPRDAVVEVWNGVPFLTPVWCRGPRMVFQHHHHGAMWPLVLPPRRAWFGSLLERRLAPPFYRGTPIVTLSASSRQDLLANLGHRPEDVHVVEPGIHTRFRPDGEPEAVPLVLSVGRLMPSKGVDRLLEAVSMARQSVHDLRLEIVGEGPEEGVLRQRAADLGISEAVRFCGRIDDQALVSAYRRATVVASASVSEGWGMTLTEAAACGTPAVASDIDGHRDAIQHGTSGLLAADSSGIAAALVEVAGNPARRSELAAGAIRMAARFDWDRTATEAFRVLASRAARR